MPQKPLDPINVPATGAVGVVVVILGILANPQAQAAIIVAVTHPTLESVLTTIGVIAGVALLYIAKPVGTSPAQKGP